jgi:large subunit ribosomal protein L25
MNTESTIGKLAATRRREKGKGVARKLRAKGFVPAVCYGQGAESIPLTVDPVALRKCLDPGRRHNTVIDLTITDGDQSEHMKVMLKDYQIDTLKRTVLHADFIRLAEGQPVQVQVPLLLEGKPEGVKLGGNLHQVFRELPVSCMPEKIPTSLSIDVSALLVGQSMQVKDLKIEEGVTINLPLSQTVALVMAPRKEREETVAVEGAAVEGEPVEGEEQAAEGGGEKEEKDKDKDKKDKKEKKDR